MLAGCASSQTSRKMSVFCQNDYLLAFDGGGILRGDNRPQAKTSQNSFHSHLKSRLDRKFIPKTPRGEETSFLHPAVEEDQIYRVLVMSGGGQNGAFGAGILNGWNKRATGVRRQDIDMITSISTGAMALTYTLVGNYGAVDQRKRADEALKVIFTESDESDLLERKGLFSILSTNSLVNTKGLNKALAEAAREFLPMIAAWPDKELVSGKMAFAGMVNLDDSKFYVANLLDVARNTKIDPSAQDCYQEIIQASSAEPVNFPPRFITTDRGDPMKGNMYVDGGLRYGVFWSESLRQLKERGAHLEVYVIINGDLAADSYVCDGQGNCSREKKVTKNKLLNIAKRTQTIATDQLYKDSLDRIYWTLVREIGKDNFTLKFSYIRPKYIKSQNCQASQSAFDRAYMSCLYKIGEQMAADWDWLIFKR